MIENFVYFAELPEKYLKPVLNYEGGYVNDPDDPGGETARGITIGALNKAKEIGLVSSSLKVKDLLTDLDSVRKIYNVNYYKKGKCDQIPHPLAFAHFDMCVNSGPGGKSKSGRPIGAGANLQKVLIALGASIAFDGSVGPNTLAALDKILANYSPTALCKLYNDEREKYFNAIVTARPLSKKFLKGWLRRLNSVRALCV